MKERREFKTITMPVSFLVFAISFLHCTKTNLYDLATFCISETFQLVIVFASLGHHHFVY